MQGLFEKTYRNSDIFRIELWGRQRQTRNWPKFTVCSGAGVFCHDCTCEKKRSGLTGFRGDATFENAAEVAQLVEQPIRNRQVPGSSPGLGSSFFLKPAMST
jgi:hypothetical protein